MAKRVDYNEDELQFATVSALLDVLGRQLPRFPTRREEAKKEVGYDVELTLNPASDAIGTPLFLQIKPPQLVMQAPTDLAVGGIRLAADRRFEIKCVPAKNFADSQHEVLLRLNAKHPCRVYYVCSRLPTRQDLHQEFLAGNLLDYAFCIHPQEVGLAISTRSGKHVYFDLSMPGPGNTVAPTDVGAVVWNKNGVLKGYDGLGMLGNARRMHLQQPASIQHVSEQLVELLEQFLPVEPVQEVEHLTEQDLIFGYAEEPRLPMLPSNRLAQIVRRLLGAETVFMVKVA